MRFHPNVVFMHHTIALILKKEEWNEADWLVTALARDFGKIRLLAQGARKHGAKLQGHLEPGCIAELSFVVGKNGYRLTTARLREFFPAIRSSFSKLRALTMALALLDINLLEEREGAQEVFRTAEECLQLLSRAEHLAALRRPLVWLQARLLYFLGVLPHHESIEASHSAALLGFAHLAPSEVEDALIDEVRLEAELEWLRKCLGSAVTFPPRLGLLDLAPHF